MRSCVTSVTKKGKVREDQKRINGIFLFRAVDKNGQTNELPLTPPAATRGPHLLQKAKLVACGLLIYGKCVTTLSIYW